MFCGEGEGESIMAGADLAIRYSPRCVVCGRPAPATVRFIKRREMMGKISISEAWVCLCFEHCQERYFRSDTTLAFKLTVRE